MNFFHTGFSKSLSVSFVVIALLFLSGAEWSTLPVEAASVPTLLPVPEGPDSSSHEDELLAEMVHVFSGNAPRLRLAPEVLQTAAQPERVLLAIEDMVAVFGDDYPMGRYYLTAYKEQMTLFRQADNALAKARAFLAMYRLRREALLANPLLDFDRILILLRRFGDHANHVIGTSAGHPDSFATEANLRPSGWDNEIAILSNIRSEPEIQTVFKPERDVILRNLDLNFDGQRVMFSSVDASNRWALFEVNIESGGLKQLSPMDLPDVDFFDSCYLPDGRIITASTASYGALDCVGGGTVMSDFYLLSSSGALRQLTFDQVHPQHPTIKNDGTVMYMRWEYSDLAHYYSRFLFGMYPDGTGQRAVYGSGSMFPTAIRHARSIPGHASKIVAILGGHHGIAESGRLVIIDPALARGYPFRYTPPSKEWAKPGSLLDIYPEVLPAEQTGFVQEIPGYGKEVVGNVRDELVDGVWPHFVYPYPLSEHHFLVSMKYDKDSLWGLYLVDIFDNMTLIKEQDGAAIFEPLPLRPRKMPPIIPDRVDTDQNTARFLIQDIYAGEGLKGLPRGTVSRLRIFAYHFSYLNTGNHHALSRGMQGPWDVRRILGTVPVEKDGSVFFEAPADTPISIQPIDEQGRAVQLMRSWTVGMPGETVSCIGCHEKMDQTPPANFQAVRRVPANIEPWYGPSRPYAYEFEVQPVLDKHCAGCHDDTVQSGGLSFVRTAENVDYQLRIPAHRQVRDTSRTVERSFDNLHPFARRPGPESQLMMHVPMEFHASTSPLIQMLERGHYGVELDRESYERLYTWIDLNTPFYGRWNPSAWRGQDQAKRRAELALRFSSQGVNPEEEYKLLMQKHAAEDPIAFTPPATVLLPEEDDLDAAKFLFDDEHVHVLRKQAEKSTVRRLMLSDNLSMELVYIPAGQFVMGSVEGYADERPRSEVEIKKPFWMGVTEVVNAHYAVFDPDHDTGYHVSKGKDKAVPGEIGNHPDQPVSRVSWQEAMAFCRWLSEKTGLNVTLPTEAQWEWAARAGTITRFYWGGLEADFSGYANLADRRRLYTRTDYEGPSRLQTLRPWDPDYHYPLRDGRFDDGALVTHYAGQYQANAFGLKDIIGNVSEWTRTGYMPYPYRDDDGRNALNQEMHRVARGGSWYDRPKDAGAAIRYAYAPFQKVFNVGFRVIIEE